MKDSHLHMSDGVCVCKYYILVMNVQHAILSLARARYGSKSPTGGSRCLDCDIIHCAPCQRTVIISGAVFSSLMTPPHDAPLALPLPLRPPPKHCSQGQELAQSPPPGAGLCGRLTEQSPVTRIERGKQRWWEERKVDEVLARN